MKELSDKEIEALYKEEKMKEIPDLWKKIEGNLAPRTPVRDADLFQGEGAVGPGKKKVRWLRYIGAMAAMLAVALLVFPAWQFLSGGVKSYDGGNASMEAPMEADSEAPMDAGYQASGESGAADKNQAAGESGAAADKAEAADGGSDPLAPWADGAAEEEFHLEVELLAEQVQTTLEGYLVTGRILWSEENWFEEGERVTLFYEGDAYGEEDFSGSLRVLLDVEEENLKILEILP